MAEWRKIITHRAKILEKFGNVRIELNTTAEATEDLTANYDWLVIATGSYWARDGLNGVTNGPIDGADAELPWCITPEQYSRDGKPIPGSRVVIYDCEGHYVGVGLAEALATLGYNVAYLTPLETIAPFMRLTGEAPRLRRRLVELGVACVPETVVLKVDERGVTTRALWSESVGRFEADGVVLITQRVSDDSLLRALVARDPTRVFGIGDCVAPGRVGEAIFAGHRLGREIDSQNPHVPLPFIRERRLWGETTDAEYRALGYT
jgi:dimethylamine/trimethylamine dehydrogenase